MRQALELALEALEEAWYHVGTFQPTEKAIDLYDEARTAIKEALAQPEEEKLHPVHIGVDVTREGTAVTAFYRKPDAVMEMFYSQFHPMAQPERDYERGFIDGMQKQMQSSVDKAVNRMAQPEQEPISFGIRGGMAHDIGIKND
jgi:hypothetical protein